MTPEVIRAAESIYNTSLKDIVGDESIADEALDNAYTLAERVLAHRSNYDAEGMPLPVDEGWLREQGMRTGTSVSGFPMMWMSLGPSTLVWPIGHNEVGYGGISLPATRPRLRALLAAMGR